MTIETLRSLSQAAGIWGFAKVEKGKIAKVEMSWNEQILPSYMGIVTSHYKNPQNGS